MASNKILDYLATIEENIRTQKSPEERFLHEQMIALISAQRTFISKYYPEPQLSFHSSGMPSLASFREDIKFSNIEGLCDALPVFNANASSAEYGKAVGQYAPEELRAEKAFSLAESDLGLTLAVHEDHYVDGFDILSQTVPIASRRGTATYAMPHRRLTTNTQVRYAVTNADTALIARAQPSLVPITNTSINAKYTFTFEDYNLPETPGVFGPRKKYPKQWNALILAGYPKRLELFRAIHNIIAGAVGEVDYERYESNWKPTSTREIESRLGFPESRLSTSYHGWYSSKNYRFKKNELILGTLSFDPPKNDGFPISWFRNENIALDLNLGGIASPRQNEAAFREIKQLGFKEQ